MWTFGSWDAQYVKYSDNFAWVSYWTHACGRKLFEMITGMMLFRPRPDKLWCEDTDMLLEMNGYLKFLTSPFPLDLLAAGPRTRNFFNKMVCIVRKLYLFHRLN